MLSGTLILIEDDGESVLQPGDCLAWKAGLPSGHHLVNRSASDATFLIVGTNIAGEKAHYPDIDLAFDDDEDGKRFTRKNGTPYQAP